MSYHSLQPRLARAMTHYGADVLRNRELTLSLWVRQQGFHVFGQDPGKLSMHAPVDAGITE
jgi:hypothetical protein